MRERASQRSLELFKAGCFCSGISRTGGMCGAVSVAIMGINLVAGLVGGFSRPVLLLLALRSGWTTSRLRSNDPS